MLSPPFLLAHTPSWQDPLALAAVLGVSLIAASEIVCASSSLSVGASSMDDLVWLNRLQGGALLLCFEIALFWRLERPAGSLAWTLAGLAGLSGGGILRALAIRRLAGGFANGSRPASQTLCVDGVYAFMRHPAEVGVLLIAASFPLMLGMPVFAVVVWPVFLLLSWLRIQNEDRSLARAFPVEYKSYSRRVRW